MNIKTAHQRSTKINYKTIKGQSNNLQALLLNTALVQDCVVNLNL